MIAWWFRTQYSWVLTDLDYISVVFYSIFSSHFASSMALESNLRFPTIGRLKMLDSAFAWFASPVITVKFIFYTTLFPDISFSYVILFLLIVLDIRFPFNFLPSLRAKFKRSKILLMKIFNFPPIFFRVPALLQL